MIDYRVNAARQRRLAFRRFKSYVSRRPGERADTEPSAAGSRARALAADPWRAVAAFSSESVPSFLANKLRYSFIYKAVGLLVVVFCVLVSSFLAVTYAKVRGGIRRVDEAVKTVKSLTFLVLGADDMKGERGRSDAVMLVRIDMANKQIRGLSIPRDSYVMLHHKGESMDKLNHAYFFGGAELSKSTVEAYTGVKVDHHVVVNYELFERVVDLAGGVPIDVEKRMDYDDNAGGLHIHLMPGPQILDGVSAKGYVRFRHDAAGDFGRMKRQQKFAKAFLERLKSPKVIALLAINFNTLFGYVKTDVPLDFAIGLLYLFKDFDPRDVEVKSIPAESRKMWAPRYRLNLSFMVSNPEDVVASCQWLLTGSRPESAPSTPVATPTARAPGASAGSLSPRRAPEAAAAPAPAARIAPARPRAAPASR
ncbi:MAG: LCP family protein [Candidatus Wallbacteria bacterium]|nr:LCP family protein [Candidatus Wallbacteria bacterium]